MSERISGRCEKASARRLTYLSEKLSPGTFENPAPDSEQFEKMVERVYWMQMLSSLRRGLVQSERPAQVRH